MREECTESDALEVIQIMRASMIDTYTDENGQLDFTRQEHGSGMSRSSDVCFPLFLFNYGKILFVDLGEETNECCSTCM